MSQGTTRRAMGRALRKATQKPNAELGKITGKVPGRQNYSYVLTPGSDLPLVVYNGKVSQRPGQRVWISRDERQGRLVRVLDAHISEGDVIGSHHNPQVGDHAPNHYLDGPDPVFIHTKQIEPLAVYPDSGVKVRVNPGDIHLATGFYHVHEQVVDLTGHQPASGVRYVLILLSLADGSISVQDGADQVLADLSYADIPAVSGGFFALAAVRLFGQTSISGNAKDPDIIDLRFTGGAGGGGSQTPATTLYHAGTATAYPATAAGILSALAVAAVGDRVGLFPGSYTGDFELGAGVALDGPGYAGATLMGTVTLGNGSSINNLTINLTETGATPAVGVEGPATGGATIQQCTIIVAQTDTASATGIHLNSGYVSARDTYIRVSAADAGAAAKIIDSTGAVDDCIFEFCAFANALDLDQAPAANWTIASGVTPDLANCIWPAGWTPTGVAYQAGDRSSIGHTHTFLSLDDTPASYTGYGSKVVRVAPSETGLEFVDETALELPPAVSIFMNKSFI